MEWITAFELELRTAIFLAGIRRARDLPRASVVVTGSTLAWLEQLGYRRPAPRRTKRA
jgi:isopentenyl diphosphate isomerase/L-lactate dehydrogenase-like FMN-dependent dehydrogenase